jgi:hypothetical protein
MTYPIVAHDPTKYPITLQQSKVLGFATEEVREGRPFPTLRKIASHMGWKNETSARDCLRKLEWRGKVQRRVNGAWELVQ